MITAVLGPRAGGVIEALALVVLLGGLNGNLFVTPRVLFGLSRDGLGPALLTRVNRGGTPGPAMWVVGLVSMLLAATGSFERLLSLAIVLVLATDGFMVLVLFRLRVAKPGGAFPRAALPRRAARLPVRLRAAAPGLALAAARPDGGSARRAARGRPRRARGGSAGSGSLALGHGVVVAVELAGVRVWN